VGPTSESDDRRRLADCCAATGIGLSGAHSALGDARATATLLASFLDPSFGTPPGRELLTLPERGWAVSWPTTPGGVRPPLDDRSPMLRRIAASYAKPPAPPLVRLLENVSLADALDEGAPDGSLPYLELLAADWALGEPLRVGDEVAFTGELEHQRQQLEQRAQQLGVRVMGNVSRRTTLLVTDGRFVGSKSDVAAVHGTRCVPSDEFAILLDHLQPAARTATGSIPRPRSAVSPQSSPTEAGTLPVAHVTVSPTAVRAWARGNGSAIGDRGRLPSEVLDAYRRAHGVPAGR
jgi:DNA polymerase-3 subunit epsilon